MTLVSRLLCWRHLYGGCVISSIDIVVPHRATDQDLNALREVIKFGVQQEVVDESGSHTSTHWPHPVHLQQASTSGQYTTVTLD